MQYYIFTLGLLLIGLLVLRLLGFTFTLGFCTIILFLYLVQDSLLYVPGSFICTQMCQLSLIRLFITQLGTAALSKEGSIRKMSPS